MENRRFDDLTRVLAAGASRRSLLRWLGGGIAGATVGLPGTVRAERDPGADVPASCADSTDCEGELICLDGACREAIAGEELVSPEDTSLEADEPTTSTTTEPDEQPEIQAQTEPLCEQEPCEVSPIPACLETGVPFNEVGCGTLDIPCCDEPTATYNPVTCTCEIPCLEPGTPCTGASNCCGTWAPGAQGWCVSEGSGDATCMSCVETGFAICFQSTAEELNICCNPNAVYNGGTCSCELTCAPPQESCEEDSECCDPDGAGVRAFCDAVSTRCSACYATDERVECDYPADPNNLSCCDSEAVLVSNAGDGCICRVIEQCLSVGDTCDSFGGDGSCCSGSCEGTCCLSADVTDTEEHCGAASDCCSAAHLCQSGLCCNPAPFYCGNDQFRCCDGAECIGQWCVAVTECEGRDSTCQSDDDCCDDLQCVRGSCGYHDVCVEKDGVCNKDTPCCKGLHCKHGHCKRKRRPGKPEKPSKPHKSDKPHGPGKPSHPETPEMRDEDGEVHTLPSTGAGTGPQASGWLTSAVLGAGAAIAARVLRQRDAAAPAGPPEP